MAASHGPAGRHAIVGVAEAGLGKAPPGSTALTLQCRAARDAMLDAGLMPSDIDGVVAHWDDRASALLVAEYLDIRPAYIDSTVAGGGSPLTQLIHAAAAIAAGLCRTVLLTYGSTQRSDRSRQRLGHATDPRSPSGQFVLPHGLPSPIGWYAMLAQRYLHERGAGPADLGAVASQARRWAALNPNATLTKALTIEDYLASPPLCDPLRRADICLVSDGAGAMILTGVERARELPRVPVVLRGFGDHYRHHLTPLAPTDWLADGALAECSARALAMAGVGRDEVSLLQIYDAFTVNVLVALEAMGFAAPGEAGAFMRSEAPAPGGRLPVNTSGGGLAFNHSGQFGMQLCIEAVRQLRGECGARQVGGARTCLVQAGGMLMSAEMVLVLSRDRG